MINSMVPVQISPGFLFSQSMLLAFVSQRQAFSTQRRLQLRDKSLFHLVTSLLPTEKTLQDNYQ